MSESENQETLPEEQTESKSVEIEINPVEKFAVPPAVPENPTRLITTDNDLGPQMTPVNQESFPHPVPETQPVPETTPVPEAQPVPETTPVLEAQPAQELASSPTHPVAEVQAAPELASPPETKEKYWDAKDILSAPDFTKAMEAYLKIFENYQHLTQLAKTQEAMAKKLLELDMPDESLKFTILAGETINAMHQQNMTVHMEEIIQNHFYRISQEFIEGLEQQIRNLRNSSY